MKNKLDKFIGHGTELNCGLAWPVHAGFSEKA